MSIIKGHRNGAFLDVATDVRFMGQLQSRYANPWAKSWFVDGADGVDTNSGTNPSDAYKTIQKAVTAAGRGDVIYIRPQKYTLGTGFNRYTEDVIVPASTWDLSIIGVTNTLNPEFGVRWKHVATPLTVLAAGCHLENIGFFCEGATYAINLSNDLNVTYSGTNGFSMYNCAVKGARVLINGGDGARIYNTYFQAVYDGSVTGGITALGTTNPLRRLSIKDCVFFGGNGTAAATQFITLTGATVTETLIKGCDFGAVPQDGKYLVNTSVTGGLITQCNFGKANASITADMTLDTMIQVGNYDGTGSLVI